ncbi:MAG TPA: hypothetical protein VD886_18715 [Herpetosiphonaceae bacterium]|nr:hypothetical protein [Herpetosiphonaceae bacterium]
MKQQMRLIVGLALAALIGGCGAQPARPTLTDGPPPTPLATESPPPAGAMGGTTFADGQSIALAAAADGGVYAALGDADGLAVARLLADGSWGPPVRASGGQPVLVHPAERPAIAVAPGGRVAVAWLDTESGELPAVWYAQSGDGGASFGEPTQVAQAGGPSAAMVSIAFDQQNPLAVWLDGSDLALARSADGGRSWAAKSILDSLICDCCQPAPLLVGSESLVAFRNVVKEGADDLRDIYVARLDGDRAAGAPVQASDASWQINACPISGPALALGGDSVFAAWMDGRADVDHSGRRSDIWLARSADGGRTFGANLRVNPAAEGQHTLPTLAAAPDGRLHLSWLSVDGQDHSIVHTSSADGGASFTPPQTIASNTLGDGGRPNMPSLAVAADGRAYLAWTDKQGAHVVDLGK